MEQFIQIWTSLEVCFQQEKWKKIIWGRSKRLFYIFFGLAAEIICTVLVPLLSLNGFYKYDN